MLQSCSHAVIDLVTSAQIIWLVKLVGFLVSLVTPVMVRTFAPEVDGTVTKLTLEDFASSVADQGLPVVDCLDLEFSEKVIKFARN